MSRCLSREVTELWQLHIQVAVRGAVMLSKRENGQIESKVRSRAVGLGKQSLQLYEIPL